MKAVVQRVSKAILHCDNKLISQIDGGLVVYFGVATGDNNAMADSLAKKIANLRIFSDEQGKMNLSVIDKQQEILCVSQFTLLADTAHGNRPSFTGAEKPELANKLYIYFCEKLQSYGISVKRGVFGGDMVIEQTNIGPVTILLNDI